MSGRAPRCDPPAPAPQAQLGEPPGRAARSRARPAAAPRKTSSRPRHGACPRRPARAGSRCSPRRGTRSARPGRWRQNVEVPQRAQSGVGSHAAYLRRRKAVVVKGHASRQAGSAMARVATSVPASSEPTAQVALERRVAPKLDESNATAPMPTADARPTAPPTRPTSTDSASARRTSTEIVAPRVRRSAWSRRRRSAPAPAIAPVSRTASSAPGRPRKRNAARAYRLSPRAASSAVARLLPDRDAPRRPGLEVPR